MASKSYRQIVNRKQDAEAHDFYATDPHAALDVIRLEPSLKRIWEPACGEGHLCIVFDKLHKLARATDLVDRGYGEVLDFFKFNGTWTGDIVTNPPYSLAMEFVLHALSVVDIGFHVVMLLPITFLESAVRYDNLFSRFPPARLWVYSKRITCAKNADFETYSKQSMKCYAWYVWTKGVGNCIPEIRWIR